MNNIETKKTESQRVQILNDLKLGYAISPIKALQSYGCFRLASVIHRLRNQGYKIETITGKYNYASYKLIDSN